MGTKPAQEIGTKKLRPNLSKIVRKASEGEVYVVTIAGEPMAELGPVKRPKVEASES